MIVRIATEGQYELADDDVAGRLNALDNEAVAAVEAGDEAKELFASLALADQLEDFLTLPAYDRLD